MSTNDDYFSMVQRQMQQWDAEVDKLGGDQEKLNVEARARYDAQVKAMRGYRDAAYQTLEEIRNANESAWRHMQAGMDSSWESMKGALDKTSSELPK